MIAIKQEILWNMIAHARRELPNKACGYLAGNDGTVTLGYQLPSLNY